MKILITGINGFIGQHLGKALLDRGHYVMGLGRQKQCAVARVAYYQVNILSKQHVAKTMGGVNVVVHLAALTSHNEIVDNKLEALETNFLGTKNVLDVFIKSVSAKKFLYPSTGKVYGMISSVPISENHPTNPINILGKSKFITERLIDFYSNNQKEFIIFRVFNSYGSLQGKNFLIPTILRQLNEGKKEVTLGDIETKRDYIFIDDLVAAFIMAIEGNGQQGISVYNICTGIGSSAAEIVKIISKIKRMKILIKINHALQRTDEMKNEYGSYAKAKKILGWQPKFTLEEGLKRLLKN